MLVGASSRHRRCAVSAAGSRRYVPGRDSGCGPGASRARRADGNEHASCRHQPRSSDMAVTTENPAGATAIRPFTSTFPRRSSRSCARVSRATRWPEKETVADQSQGVPLATMQELARYWATDYDWRKVRGAAERPAAVHHRDRRAGHPLHPRSLEARERAAAHRHARMARLDHRAAEDHRSADRSHGPRRRARRTPSTW